MKLNLGSLAFNADIETGGGTPTWGTELGQGDGYKFTVDNKEPLFTAMVYCSVSDQFDKITCPLGKGGSRRGDYEYVLASLFEKVFVNGKHVPEASFLLLIVKQIKGDFHIGRRTLKYNPRMTYDGEEINRECYEKMAATLGVAQDAAWFIDEINVRNQDELHFVAYVLNQTGPQLYGSNQERKEVMLRFRNAGEQSQYEVIDSAYRPYITSIKSKPFLLLAGISGTGKSRIVRELARACWTEDSAEREAHKPKNFEMIQVKPNWHDSSELIGYISRISGEPIFVAGEFLKFIARAWEDKATPYFLCLDEMNLAPVEQYFAEYLSVIESRKSDNKGNIITDPIINSALTDKRDENTQELIPQKWYANLVDELLMGCPDDKIFGLRHQFLYEGISIPQNLIVVGTVNMDETTFSFSRKVLDRAMTIEMNEVNLESGLYGDDSRVRGKLETFELIGTAAEGKDVYSENKEVCDKAINYLKAVNAVLEGTPFKVAYRTRNEFLLYVTNNLPYNKDEEGHGLTEGFVIARALDEITSMKILSRIEGDESKVAERWLEDLKKVIAEELVKISGEFAAENSVSLKKLDEMKMRLSSGYTSFWS